MVDFIFIDEACLPVISAQDPRSRAISLLLEAGMPQKRGSGKPLTKGLTSSSTPTWPPKPPFFVFIYIAAIVRVAMWPHGEWYLGVPPTSLAPILTTLPLL